MQMKSKLLNEKTTAELLTEKEKLQKEARELRFKKVTGVVENPLRKKIIKKTIAKINTIVHMRGLEKIKKELAK
jgi:large subunit ribosomal protein L29